MAELAVDIAAPPRLVASGLRIDYEIEDRVYCAVGDITMSIPDESFVCVVGPSGCGKSSLLSAVAGLQPYSAGRLELCGRPVTEPGPDRAVVFQDAALFPWRTVLRNVTYGLEMRGVKRAEAAARASAMIELVGLEGKSQLFPHQLSGGMRQRVNLARALVQNPSVLLLDEPFAALDAQTRAEMQLELLRIWQDSRMTALLVTHHIDEAVLLGDQVIVLGPGPASSIVECVDVPFARPRAVSVTRSPAFGALVGHISSILRRQLRSRPQLEKGDIA